MTYENRGYVVRRAMHRFGGRVLRHYVPALVGIVVLVVAMGGTWALASPAPSSAPSSGAVTSPSIASSPPAASSSIAPVGAKKQVTGKLNLNTATPEQLMLLPTIGPSKAERIVTWRKKNGGFKRIADLRRVKGFGFKTFKRLEAFLDVQGESTLAPKR